MLRGDWKQRDIGSDASPPAEGNFGIPDGGSLRGNSPVGNRFMNGSAAALFASPARPTASEHGRFSNSNLDRKTLPMGAVGRAKLRLNIFLSPSPSWTRQLGRFGRALALAAPSPLEHRKGYEYQARQDQYDGSDGPFEKRENIAVRLHEASSQRFLENLR